MLGGGDRLSPAASAPLLLFVRPSKAGAIGMAH